MTAIKEYSILGRYKDVEIDIRLAADPSLLLIVTHIAKPKVEIGDVVQRGATTLGSVRGFPAALDQALSQYTSDNGDHVQLMMLRVTPELATCEQPPKASVERGRGRTARAPDVPAATRAIIGGSGSLAADFPGDLHPDARVLDTGLVFETPWGESPPFTLFELGGQRGAARQDARLAQGRLARPRLAPGLQRAAPRRRQAHPLGRRGRQPRTTCSTPATSWSWTTSST